ncbi:15-cis-phytoene desaturase [Gimesia panareensis]|uniref:15-cis-phytoene desaturase n=1 Tax=Gimesia panareensis TaxID=2527978 RepID=A0A518FXB5_9PLAN|nr:15-cis-phytoene desaturase [Gimesia panareensis]
MEDSSAATVIVGGGLAGLACAAALAERGKTVTLLESRPRLGGRASSFEDQQSQTLIDNCQHVSMGCCHEFNRFCQTVGIADSFERAEQLFFIGPDRTGTRFKINRFAASPLLPTPLHLFPAFARLSYLSFREKRELAHGLKQLAHTRVNPEDEPTMADWLKAHGQSQTVIDRFWNVVLVSALSEDLERISLSHARKVFVDGFLRARNSWQVLIPTTPLEDLYGTTISNWLIHRGAEIRLKTGVKQIRITDGKVTGVELRDGTQLDADRVVLAVPHQRVLDLLPTEFPGRAELSRIEQLEAAPITSVHLWFDREITPLPHAVFVDCLSQWMFNRTQLMQQESNGRWYYQIVISASHQLTAAGRQGRSQDEIIQEVISELTRIWPATAEAQLLHSRMLTEHHAVFSVQPGVDQLRPAQRTRAGGLYLAGDWTSTGWPATMEGAVRSGLLAAEAVLDDLGQPESLLLPPEKTAFLSKMLFRL